MPIRPPSLDDRSFQDLVNDLLAQLPAHAPEYTNPQIGDPGRTLIELFAWLADTILYRVNLIPERQRLAFLSLLGMPLRAAVAARGLISIQLDDQLSGSVTLPALCTVEGPVQFETTTPIAVLPVTMSAFYKRKLSDEEQRSVGSDVLDSLPEVYNVKGKRALYYETTPVFVAGTALPEGLDLVEDTIDASLWLALIAPKAELVTSVREELGRGAAGAQQLLNVALAPSLEVPALFEDIARRAQVPHVWEITTGAEIDDNAAEFLTLERASDTTSGFTRSGVMRLLLPAAARIGAPASAELDPLRAGLGDRPPRLDDAKLAARVVTWIRLRPTQKPGETTQNLKLSWVDVNGVEIEQRKTMTAVVVGTSDGSANQELQLPASGVEAETLVLEVEQPEGFVAWTRVDDLAIQSRDAAVFTLDAEAGMVRFGNGAAGAIPPQNARVRAAVLRAGGGAAGNLAPGTLRKLRNPTDIENNRVTRPLKVQQGLPTTGGQDSETLVDAERRIPSTLRHGERAVTVEDFRILAAETPGVAVGRVEVLPRFKPQQRRDDVPGVVSVMVLPFKGVRVAPNPRAGRPFLEAVHAQLDSRRLLSTELYTIGCEYVPIAVAAGVDLREGAPREEVLLAVRDAIRRYLWPLPPGGPDATGWPLRRPVRDRELEVVVAQVPGVSEVRGVRLFERDVTGKRWSSVTTVGSNGAIALSLESWQLPEVLAVIVLDGADAPSDPERLPNPFLDADAPGVGIPLKLEIC